MAYCSYWKSTLQLLRNFMSPSRPSDLTTPDSITGMSREPRPWGRCFLMEIIIIHEAEIWISKISATGDWSFIIWGWLQQDSYCDWWAIQNHEKPHDRVGSAERWNRSTSNSRNFEANFCRLHNLTSWWFVLASKISRSNRTRLFVLVFLRSGIYVNKPGDVIQLEKLHM